MRTVFTLVITWFVENAAPVAWIQLFNRFLHSTGLGHRGGSRIDLFFFTTKEPDHSNFLFIQEKELHSFLQECH